VPKPSGPTTARVHDRCHAPYLRPGDILHLDPARAARPGDLVVAVRAADVPAMIAELVGAEGATLTLRQGQQTLRKRRSHYSAIVVVVGWRRGD
jgi:hypothetical protein